MEKLLKVVENCRKVIQFKDGYRNFERGRGAED